MTRPFSPSQLRLPKLRATGALVLAKQLLDAAQDQPLPDHVARALKSIEADRAALRGVLGDAAQVDEASGVRQADIIEDAAWGVLRDWAEAWGRLPGDLGDKARSLGGAVFGDDGLAFVQLPVEEEREVGDAKLGVIGKKKHEQIVEELGGKPILEHLRSVHERYGQIIDAARAAERDEAPGVKEPKGRLQDAMQTYVTRVAGVVERDVPATRTLAEALLRPLLVWDRNQPGGPSEPAPPAVVAPKPA